VSALFLTACSQNADSMASQGATSQQVTDDGVVEPAKPAPMGIEHTHPANSMTNSVIHTHRAGRRPPHNYGK